MRLPTVALLGIAAVARASTPHVVHLDPRQVPDALNLSSPCSGRMPGPGPYPSEDDSYHFAHYPEFTALAENATKPSNYSVAFTAQPGAVMLDSGYLGYFNMLSYDAQFCADRCDEETLCRAFNIYFERAPMHTLDKYCPTAEGTTDIKCVLWGREVDALAANNTGSQTYGFIVKIAGSNGYNQGEGKKRYVVCSICLNESLMLT